jgi:hypothetical protein
MKRNLDRRALIGAIVAVLVALCFLWPHSLADLLPQDGDYSAIVMQTTITDGEMGFTNPAYEVEEGSEEDAALRDLLGEYHYYFTPLSLLQSMGLFRDTNTTDYLYFVGGDIGSVILANDGSVVRTATLLRAHIGLGGRGQSQELIDQALDLLHDWGAVDRAAEQ